jgi:hypothetical protein
VESFDAYKSSLLKTSCHTQKKILNDFISHVQQQGMPPQQQQMRPMVPGMMPMAGQPQQPTLNQHQMPTHPTANSNIQLDPFGA